MKVLLILLLILLISGCSVLEKVVSKGAEISDNGLVIAADTYCKIASIGSITRKMSVDEYLELRRLICGKNDNWVDRKEED